MLTTKATKKDFVKNNPRTKQYFVLNDKDLNTNKTLKIPVFYLYSVILLFIVILYGNTIINEYALDDSIVITLNKYTQQGVNGIKDIFLYDSFKGFDDKYVNSVSGGRYRPLSIATFAIEKQLFGNNPHISHIFNILFYACSCLLLYSLLLRLFSSKFKPQNWYNSVPFLATVLFAAHPIHTEVVANIKSRDEILALLLSFSTMWCILNYFETKKILYLVFSPIVFFLALLSKEIAIVFILLIPITIYFFTKVSLRKILLSMIPLIVISILFVLIRQLVLYKTGLNQNIIADITNDSFVEMNIFQKYATIIYSLGLYFKLTFIPHPLTWDYYPYHIAIMEWTNFWVLVSLFTYLVLIYFAIKGLRSKNFYSYCIIVFLVPLSLTANILFPVGAFMCERFLYISSLGFALLLAYFIVEKPIGLFAKMKLNPLYIIIPILILYSIKTISRNKDWKNDETIVTTDVQTSKNSMRSTSEYGNMLFFKAEKMDNVEEKFQYYDASMQYEEKAYSICKNLLPANFILGTLYGKYKNDLNKSIFYLENAIKIDPDNIDSYNNLGIIYCMSKHYSKAIDIFEFLLKKDPINSNVIRNLAMAYSYVGQQTKADYFAKKLKEIENSRN
jgi:protein O-mannosyl-transferase